jgi:hypothetical protein
MTSIYQRLVAAGVPLDNHESDLYAKVTGASRPIVEERMKAGVLVTVFASQIDGLWYDIPFAFEPWWNGGRP